MCLGSNGCLHIVKCKIYNQVEGKDKLLAPKWDSFYKHVDRMKAHKDMGFVKKGGWYYNKGYKHGKNLVRFSNQSCGKSPSK
jgi:hypothetical protein